MIIQRTKVVQMSGITKQNHKILFFLFPNRENSENNKGVLIRHYC